MPKRQQNFDINVDAIVKAAERAGASLDSLTEAMMKMRMAFENSKPIMLGSIDGLGLSENSYVAGPGVLYANVMGNCDTNLSKPPKVTKKRERKLAIDKDI